MMMFSLKELLAIAKALVMQEKSVQRLAAKEGQPETVAIEYRKVGQEISELFKKVNAEINKLEVAANAAKK